MAESIEVLIQLASADTGLTITAKTYNTSNVLVDNGIGTIAELSNGEYLWRATTLTDGFVGHVRFYNGATYLTSYPLDFSQAVAVDSEEIIDGVVAALSGQDITIVSPFAANGLDVSLRRGDDYAAALENALTWSGSDWPDLSAATVEFSAKDKTTGAIDLDSISVAVSNGGQATQTLTLELDNADTATLSLGTNKYAYDIQATISGKVITLVSGSLSVFEDFQSP